MFRSRIKRAQLLQSSPGGTLKKPFVSPVQRTSKPSETVSIVHTTSDTKNLEVKENLPSTSSVTSSAKSSKPFSTPFRTPQTKSEIPPKQMSITEEGKRYCFNVMYFKAGPKKKKTYLDGILFVDKKMYSLFEPSGKLVRKSLETYDASDFVIGCTIDLGVWCCEIGSSIPEEDFISGRVFLQSSTVDKKVLLPPSSSSSSSSSSVTSKRFSLHSKTNQPLSTAPKTYTGLYTPTDDSFIIQPSFTDEKGNRTAPVVLDPHLAHVMKPHQKEGLVFLYNCINGLTDYRGNGCILADEMGLGKTLTAISLIFTSLTQSPYAVPLVSSAVVTCPSSLVDNWGNEFVKWIGRDKVRCIVLKEKGAKAEEKINQFVMQSGLKRVVLVISYEV